MRCRVIGCRDMCGRPMCRGGRPMCRGGRAMCGCRRPMSGSDAATEGMIHPGFHMLRRHERLRRARPPPLRRLGEHLLGLRGSGPYGGILAQQRGDHGPERTGVLGRFGLLLDNGLHGAQRRGAPERRPALHRRVQRRAQRPQVGGRTGIVAAHPLGGQIVDRADDLAGAREGRIALDLCDPEVGEQYTPVGGQEYVPGLHVTVQHAGWRARPAARAAPTARSAPPRPVRRAPAP